MKLEQQKEISPITSKQSLLNSTAVVNVVNVNVLNGKTPKTVLVKASQPTPSALSSSSSINSSSSSTSSLTTTAISSKAPFIDVECGLPNSNVTKSSFEEAPPIPPRKSFNLTNTNDIAIAVNRLQKLPQSFEKNEEPTAKLAELAQQEISDSDDDSNPICGPAETICGIIVGEVS